MNKLTSLCLAAALGSVAAFADVPEGGYFANLTDANGDPVSTEKFYSISVDGNHNLMGIHQSSDNSFRLKFINHEIGVQEVFAAWKIIPVANNADGKFHLYQPHVAVEKSGNGYIKISNNNNAEGGGNIRPDGNASTGNLFWQVAIDTEGHENEYQLYSVASGENGSNKDVIIGNPSTSNAAFIGVYLHDNEHAATTNTRSHIKFTPLTVIKLNVVNSAGNTLNYNARVNNTAVTYNSITNVNHTNYVSVAGEVTNIDFAVEALNSGITKYAVGTEEFTDKAAFLAKVNELAGTEITVTITATEKDVYSIRKVDMAGRELGTQTVYINKGTNFADSNISAVNNYTFDSKTVEGSNGEFNVTAKFHITNMPFTTDGTWYYVKIHSDNLHNLRYETTGTKVQENLAIYSNIISPANINKVEFDETDMKHMWRFEGNETDGFKLISRAMPEGHSLNTATTETAGPLQSSTDDNRWFLENNGGAWFFRCGNATSNNRLNHRQGNLGTWNVAASASGNGSKVFFYLAQSEQIPEVFRAMNPERGTNAQMRFDSNTNIIGTTTTNYDGASFLSIEATDDNTGFYLRTNEATPRYATQQPSANNNYWQITSDKTQAGVFTLRLYPGNLYSFTIKGQSSNNDSYSMHYDGYSRIVRWNADRSLASRWNLISINDEYDALKATAETFLTPKVGYKYNPDAQTSIDEAEAMKESDIFGALTKLASITDGELVLPTAGKFYAIRDHRYNTYVDGSTTHNTGNVNKIAHYAKGENGLNAGQIWYFDADMKGHNLATGYGVYNGTEPSGASNAQVFTFEEKNLTVQPVTFAVRVPHGSNNAYWYIWNSDNTNNHGGVDRNGNTYNATNCQFYIEEVEELPVTIDANGFASFSFPVAVQLPDDGVTAYKLGADATPIYNDDVVDPNTGKVTQYGNKLHYMTLIRHENDIVPANTPVILVTAHAGETLYLPIVAETPASRSAEGNGLNGTAATIVKPEGTHYVVTSSATGDPDADNDGKTDGVNVKLTKHEAADIPGFSAYYTLPATYDGTTPNTIWLNGEGVPSSIVEINSAAERAATEAIYDLQGRRVNSAAHGLYIINGKKVYVK